VIDVTEAIAGRGRHLPAVPILEAV
jgi:hypothetical protein